MQSEVVEALLKPESYDEEVEGVEMLQTHISWVFLTGKYAYKVKKPVDFEFLDFTTLEKRKHYCEEEIRVNRPLCGDMYLGVVPITRGNGIKISGEGEVIEYAVKMREMPQDAIMEVLLRKGEVGEKEIETIAELLADFHSKARTGEGVDEYGSIAQITKNWVQNFEQTREMRGTIVEPFMYDFIEKNVMSYIERNKELLEDRIAGGWIRECHGDVHSGNIFILKEGAEIYIFDAIEFNPAFSCSDVVAEIAFLAMDLEFHNKDELAKDFVKCYSQRTKDLSLYKLLPFYKCYRAYVRAKVIGFKLGDPTLDEKEKKKAARLAKKYYNLAYQYAKEMFQQQFNPYLF
jgi:hypothetical protein